MSVCVQDFTLPGIDPRFMMVCVACEIVHAGFPPVYGIPEKAKKIPLAIAREREESSRPVDNRSDRLHCSIDNLACHTLKIDLEIPSIRHATNENQVSPCISRVARDVSKSGFFHGRRRKDRFSRIVRLGLSLAKSFVHYQYPCGEENRSPHDDS
jgi:hypothetical protein